MCTEIALGNSHPSDRRLPAATRHACRRDWTHAERRCGQHSTPVRHSELNNDGDSWLSQAVATVLLNTCSAVRPNGFASVEGMNGYYLTFTKTCFLRDTPKVNH